MKFKVTPELALLLKTLQNQGNSSARDLAAHVSKSPSYISKLENGDVKMIQKDALTQILLYLTESTNFYEEALPKILRTLQSFMDPKQMADQIWLLQYDVMERPVKLPEKLREDIRSKMQKLQLPAELLAEAVNTESEPQAMFLEAADEVVGYHYKDTSVIRMKQSLSVEELNAILSGEKEITNYAIIFSIAFQLTKYEKYRDIAHVEPEQAKVVLRDTRIYLEYYEIHSLTGYGHMISSEEFLGKQEALINSFDSVNAEIIDGIITSFHASSRHDVLKTTQLLDNLRQNLQWDLAFTMKILGIPFSSLEDMSYSNKKKLLDEIAELVQQYADLPDSEKKIENY